MITLSYFVRSRSQMNKLQFKIARFLALKASQRLRTTYQQVGEAVGWKHPTGRGLGNNLEVILRELHERGLPPLTTILVKKGERYPAPDAMAYVHAVLGSVDIENAQTSVFEFDWNSVPELRSRPEDFSRDGKAWPAEGRRPGGRADVHVGNVFLLKFNGQLHGPDGVSRPKTKEDWNDKVLLMPWEGTRASSNSDKTPGPKIVEGDLLYLWAHEDENFGSGLGLTGTAFADQVAEGEQALEIRLREFELFPHPFGFRSLGKDAWTSIILERISEDRKPRAWVVSPDEQAEIEQLISRYGSSKAAAIADAEEGLISALDRALTENWAQVSEAERERKTTVTKARPGQRKFREEAMLRHGGRCVITGFRVPAVLEAAHVIPHTGDPAFDVAENSLILRRDLHALFDARLIGIDQTSNKLMVSQELQSTAYRKLTGKTINHKLAPTSLRYQYAQYIKAATHDDGTMMG